MCHWQGSKRRPLWSAAAESEDDGWEKWPAVGANFRRGLFHVGAELHAAFFGDGERLERAEALRRGKVVVEQPALPDEDQKRRPLRPGVRDTRRRGPSRDSRF